MSHLRLCGSAPSHWGRSPISRATGPPLSPQSTVGGPGPKVPVLQHSLCSQLAGHSSCALAWGCCREKAWMWLIPRAELAFFKLPNLFPESPQEVVPPPIQSLSWIFLGVVSLSYWIFSPGFSPLLYGHYFCSYCVHLVVEGPPPESSWLLLHMSQHSNSPSLFIPPWLIWGMIWLFPGAIGKPSFLPTWQLVSLWWRMWLFPGVYVKLPLPS